eukprot:gene12098-biopygen11145
MALYFKPVLAVQQLGGSEVVVTLTRLSFEQWLPWGFVLDDDTMELRPPKKGSIAAFSPKLRGCVGMQLARINGQVVRCKRGVQLATEDRASITMHLVEQGRWFSLLGGRAGYFRNPNPPCRGKAGDAGEGCKGGIMNHPA